VAVLLAEQLGVFVLPKDGVLTMKAAILAAVLVVIFLHVLTMFVPPAYVCTPNATVQLVCLGR
jgi:hypothetical protein